MKRRVIEKLGLILKIHKRNFQILGFIDEQVRLREKYRISVVDYLERDILIGFPDYDSKILFDESKKGNFSLAKFKLRQYLLKLKDKKIADLKEKLSNEEIPNSERIEKDYFLIEFFHNKWETNLLMDLKKFKLKEVLCV